MRLRTNKRTRIPRVPANAVICFANRISHYAAPRLCDVCASRVDRPPDGLATTQTHTQHERQPTHMHAPHMSDDEARVLCYAVLLMWMLLVSVVISMLSDVLRIYLHRRVDAMCGPS